MVITHVGVQITATTERHSFTPVVRRRLAMSKPPYLGSVFILNSLRVFQFSENRRASQSNYSAVRESQFKTESSTHANRSHNGLVEQEKRDGSQSAQPGTGGAGPAHTSPDYECSHGDDQHSRAKLDHNGQQQADGYLSHHPPDGDAHAAGADHGDDNATHA